MSYPGSRDKHVKSTETLHTYRQETTPECPLPLISKHRSRALHCIKPFRRAQLRPASRPCFLAVNPSNPFSFLCRTRPKLTNNKRANIGEKVGSGRHRKGGSGSDKRVRTWSRVALVLILELTETQGRLGTRVRLMQPSGAKMRGWMVNGETARYLERTNIRRVRNRVVF